jgi:hypothetical protein
MFLNSRDLSDFERGFHQPRYALLERPAVAIPAAIMQDDARLVGAALQRFEIRQERRDAATASLSQGLFQSPILAIAEGQKIVDQLSRRLLRSRINVQTLENLNQIVIDVYPPSVSRIGHATDK